MKPKLLDLTILDGLTLLSGNHSRRDDGVCFMEAAAWVAGEGHSDHPQCVSPVIAAFMRSWNDSLPTDAQRNRLLKPLLLLTIGTSNGQENEDRRAFMCIDWIVRTFTPEWLDMCDVRYRKHTAALRALPEITTWQGLIDATPVLVDLQRQAEAARDAARDAAWAFARDAAWDAARAFARAAAWAAAWDAARDAVENKLATIKEKLQASAADLVKRMCEVHREID